MITYAAIEARQNRNDHELNQYVRSELNGDRHLLSGAHPSSNGARPRQGRMVRSWTLHGLATLLLVRRGA